MQPIIINKAKRIIATSGGEKLFLLWLVLLPFSTITHSLTGVVAIDKLIAVPLLIIGCIRALHTKIRTKSMLIYLIFCALYAFSSNIALIDDYSVFFQEFLQISINLGYFMIPTLYIYNRDILVKVNTIMIFLAMIGCISAFLVAVGVVTLPYQRFEASRLGIEGLPKAIGVFPSYGNLAQILAYAMLLWLIDRTVKNQIDRLTNIKQNYGSILFISAIMGLVGTQSRNVLFTCIITLAAGYIIKKCTIGSWRYIKGIPAILLASVMILGPTIFILGPSIFERIASLGGAGAETTALGRLSQYEVAITYYDKYPVFGVPSKELVRSNYSLDYVHSLWIGTLVRGGIVTLSVQVVWFLMVATGLRAHLRNKDTDCTFIVLAAFFVGVMNAVSFYPAMRTYMYWTIFGVVASVRNFRSTSVMIKPVRTQR